MKMTFSSLNWPRIAGWMGLAAVAAMPVTACDTGLAECTVDADCDQGKACEVAECVSTCATNGDCADDEVCVKGLTTERRVCQEQSAIMGEPLRSTYALVRDRTDTYGCDPGQPGADLAFVLLEDLQGDIVAWGRVVRDDIVADNNDFTSWSHLSGQRPDTGADSCPVFDADHVATLGCGGALSFEFVDDGGQQVQLRGGEHRLRVGEIGEQCGEEAADRYEVLLCPDAALDGLPQGCSVSIGVGQGERAFEL